MGNVMTSVSVDIPQEFITLSERSSHGADNSLQHDVKFCLAALYYQRSLVSIGKAAELAGTTRAEFEVFLSRNKIPVSMLSIADVHKDLETIKQFSS
jgi:predicted HTH domain antitoxin